MGTVSQKPPSEMTQDEISDEWHALEYLVNADDTLTKDDYALINSRQCLLENAKES